MRTAGPGVPCAGPTDRPIELGSPAPLTAAGMSRLPFRVWRLGAHWSRCLLPDAPKRPSGEYSRRTCDRREDRWKLLLLTRGPASTPPFSRTGRRATSSAWNARDVEGDRRDVSRRTWSRDDPALPETYRGPRASGDSAAGTCRGFPDLQSRTLGAALSCRRGQGARAVRPHRDDARGPSQPLGHRRFDRRARASHSRASTSGSSETSACAGTTPTYDSPRRGQADGRRSLRSAARRPARARGCNTCVRAFTAERGTARAMPSGRPT